MIYYAILPVFSLLVVVFQRTVPEILFSHRAGLEISLILVIYAGFHLDLPRGSILSVFLGYVLDCQTGAVSGFYTTVYVLLYFLSFLVSQRVYAARATFIMIFTATCCLLEGVMIWLLRTYVYNTNGFGDALGACILKAALLGAVSPLFFQLFHRIEVSLLNGGETRPGQ